MGACCQRVQGGARAAEPLDADGGGAESPRAEEASGQLERFTTLEGGQLYEALQRGSIRLARGDYFQRALEAKRPLQRRQELRDEDLWPPEEAARMWRDYKNLFLLVVSYGWLARGHPDPEMWHLRRLARIVREWKAYLRAVSEGKVRQMNVAFYPAESLRDNVPSDVGIFMDFLSLHQEPRTPEEEAAFEHGIGQINVLYAHTFASTLVCTAVPDDEPRKYQNRGWTLFEVCVTSAKPDAFLKVLFFHTSFDPEEERSTGEAFLFKHLTGRKPPCSRARFEELMESRRREVAKLPAPHNRLFTNNKDQPRLHQKYAEIWEDLRGVSSLQFVCCGWRAADVRELLGVLPSFPRLKVLNLNSNSFGDEGAEALAAGLPGGLAKLLVWNNGISEAGAFRLLEALPRGLTYLNLDNNPVCRDEAGAARLREAWRASGRADGNLSMKVWG
uniref:Uncharacterized protein n=2 Tax=Alexandrium monilatum TaxID=311494 RepID=A0A7S4SP98_9DINO